MTTIVGALAHRLRAAIGVLAPRKRSRAWTRHADVLAQQLYFVMLGVRPAYLFDLFPCDGPTGMRALLTAAAAAPSSATASLSLADLVVLGCDDAVFVVNRRALTAKIDADIAGNFAPLQFVDIGVDDAGGVVVGVCDEDTTRAASPTTPTLLRVDSPPRRVVTRALAAVAYHLRQNLADLPLSSSTMTTSLLLWSSSPMSSSSSTAVLAQRLACACLTTLAGYLLAYPVVYVNVAYVTAVCAALGVPTTTSATATVESPTSTLLPPLATRNSLASQELRLYTLRATVGSSDGGATKTSAAAAVAAAAAAAPVDVLSFSAPTALMCGLSSEVDATVAAFVAAMRATLATSQSTLSVVTTLVCNPLVGL
jgi:hypothetical protein